MIDAPASQHGAATRPISRPRIDPELDGLGEYRLYERLGTGGYATVYRARRIGEANAGDLALKRLHPHLTSDDEAVRAFGREARLAYLIDHPVIRRVYSLVRTPSELFMTMEYIDGVSVFDLLRRASAARCRLPLAGILALLHRLCVALHYAHELVDELGVPAQFVHRDVTPSNIMIARGGRLKLIDMGVATARIDGVATGNGVSRVQGKYGYMAPEVLGRAPIDRRADVFSVGVVAWELLTLCRLYPVSKPPIDVDLVRSRPIEMPSTHNVRCPAELDAIVIRALARDPAARWRSCADLADALTGLALRLRATVSDAEIADMVELVDEPVTRPRLARGTFPPASIVAPDAQESSQPAATATPPRRNSRELVIVAICAALAVVVVVLVVGQGLDVSLTTIAPDADKTLIPDALAQRRPDADAALPPDAGTVIVPDASPPTRAHLEPPMLVSGRPPRSWSAAYPYRAEVCVDVDGNVASVALREGPARLETRIVRALRQWHYAPVEQPMCFEVRANVESAL